MIELACPCGHPLPYAACCEPRHKGDRPAETAEALMRSRYSAFVKAEVDYLIRSWHPSKRGELDRRSLLATATGLDWTGLTILATEAGGPEDATGIVEFEARYRTPTATGVLHERSRFERVDGLWTYLDGVTSEQETAMGRSPGRNEPCTCGSGKKYKRCCGAVGR